MNLLVDDLSVCLHHHYLMRTKTYTHTHRIIDANQRLSSYFCRIKFIIIVFLFVFFILKEHMLQILYRLNCPRKFWKCSLSLFLVLEYSLCGYYLCQRSRFRLVYTLHSITGCFIGILCCITKFLLLSSKLIKFENPIRKWNHQVPFDLYFIIFTIGFIMPFIIFNIVTFIIASTST